jgi:hypothetical protein
MSAGIFRFSFVMRGYSRPKDGVLSHAYDPRTHGECEQPYVQRSLKVIVDCRVKPGNDR